MFVEVSRLVVRQAFRFELDPAPDQRQSLRRHAGAARYAYNWSLDICRACLAKGLPLPTAPELHRMWNRWKRENAPWWTEVSKAAPQEAMRNLSAAFKNFFDCRSGRRQGPKVGFPVYHKRGRHDSFRLTGSIRVEADAVLLPRIGKVATKEATGKFKGRILSATVRCEAGRWYVCSRSRQSVRTLRR